MTGSEPAPTLGKEVGRISGSITTPGTSRARSKTRGKKKNAGFPGIPGIAAILLAVLALATYIVLLVACVAFVSSMLALGLFIIVPPLVHAVVIRNTRLLGRRAIGSCWALGILVLLLFPAFWLIPQQVARRLDRNATLVTPHAPAVEAFANKILATNPSFDSLAFTRKCYLVGNETISRVKWRMDFETYGLLGHVATPTECLDRGEDDCQGQAVTILSVLLALGVEQAWAVETPFHWYVVARDPALPPLEAGWEKNIEEMQDKGELVVINRDGEGNMPPWRWEEVLLVFNDRETLYPVSWFEAAWYSWTATAFFVTDVFPAISGFEGALGLVLGLLALSMLLVAWGAYMDDRHRPGVKIPRSVLFLVFMLRTAVVTAVLVSWFITWPVVQQVAWDYTLLFTIGVVSLVGLLFSSDRFLRATRMSTWSAWVLSMTNTPAANAGKEQGKQGENSR